MTFIICESCGEYKQHKAKGLCNNCYAKAMRKINNEKINAKRRENYRKNLIKMRKKNKENYEKHREKRLERQKEYYYEHLQEHKERSKKYREAHRQELLDYLRQYKIDNAERIKKYDYITPTRKWRERNKDNPEFKKRRCEQAKIYRENNADKIKESHIRWRKQNPEKARMGGVRYRSNLKKCAINDLTTTQWLKIKEFFNYKCAYCGIEEKDIRSVKKHLTIDHIIPISKGGNNTASNIVPACINCNARKRDNLIKPNYPEGYEDFLKQIEIPNLDVVGL